MDGGNDLVTFLLSTLFIGFKISKMMESINPKTKLSFEYYLSRISFSKKELLECNHRYFYFFRERILERIEFRLKKEK